MGDVDLQVAVMVGDRRGVKKYIDAGGDLEEKDDDGATALFHAAFWTHVEIATDLINAGANLSTQRNDGFTALHVATKNNQPRMTELLVGAMDDLNIQEEFGDTALHCAYRSKATECIETLLAAGADSEVLNYMGKTPKQCEGTGVDRQQDEEDFDDEDDEGPRRSAAVSEAPSAGDESTVVGDPTRDQDAEYTSGKSPSRPSDGRSAAASNSPRTTRNRSGAHHGDAGSHARGDEGMNAASNKATFRVAYPPTIRGGGKWHPMTAYIFEPSAHRAVRHAHQARISGDQHHSFASSEADNTVEDCDKAIPPGTHIVCRPRFPRTCCVSPASSTVVWMKDVHAVPFEVRPPASITSGAVTGCVDFYIGAVLVGQANIEMAVVKPNDSSDAAEKQDILGPVAQVFDTMYACIAVEDEALLLPSFEHFNGLGIATVVWRPDGGNNEKETKRLIRDSSVFQICWSDAAKESDRVRNEVKYAGSLAKTGSVAVRGIYWNPSMSVTSIQTSQGLVFPVRLHNSFLLEGPCPRILDQAVKGTPPSLLAAGGAHGGRGRGGEAGGGVDHDGDGQEEAPVPYTEKLCTSAVDHTRGHIARLREMVGGADVVDVPRLVWIHPDDGGGKPGSVNIKTDDWLKKHVRVNFLCPVSMKPGRCGEDGRGYKMSFPRGWSGKIGVALKIGVLVIAAASDAGEVADLPAPSAAAIAAWGEEGGEGGKSSAEKQGDLVNAAFDALSGALADKANDLIDSAFINAEAKGSSAPSLSAQLCKEAKQSFTNLRSLLQKYDKGLKMTGLVKVTHEGVGGKSPATEWVHPSVAELFRRQGPSMFTSGALAAADADAAREARASAYTRTKRSGGGNGGGNGGGGSNGCPQSQEVMDTIRLLEKQVLAMVEDGGGGSGGA
ncbi:unnamed protein product [Scytosiphon promiscuus]